MKAEVQRDVVSPGIAARRLGIPTGDLTAIIRRGGYRWTEIKPGGKPGDRGPNRWGLTEAQLQAIIRGQERGFVTPQGPEEAKAHDQSPGGVSRVRMGNCRVKFS